MILDKILERRDLSTKDPALKALVENWGGGQSVAGAHITPENSLKISPWYAGVKILSEALASLPLIVYRRINDRSKERARNHPAYTLLHDRPNPFMTSFEFIEVGQSHLIGWGNAFSIIERNGAGQVTALWPLLPNRVRLQIFDNRLWYYWQDANGREIQIPQENILHLRGLGSDGLIGYSPVDLMREALGLAKIEEEYRARFFRNDARPGLIVEIPGVLSDEAQKRFREEWENKYTGVSNRFRVGFLEQGLKAHEIGFAPEAAQFIEGRKFQIEEIARILGIPLILLQSTEKATSWGTGIEQFLIAFMRFTVRPWVKRWEARLNNVIFSTTERQQYFCEFLVDDILRADSLTRAQVLQIWRRNAIINADEWRALENLNPLPDGQGEKYVIEANMTTLDQLGRDDDPLIEPGTDMRGLNGSANGANGHGHE